MRKRPRIDAPMPTPSPYEGRVRKGEQATGEIVSVHQLSSVKNKKDGCSFSPILRKLVRLKLEHLCCPLQHIHRYE